MVQHALIVGSVDPTVQVSSGAMFGPQRDFWIGGPITAVNYGNAGALRGCAEVRAHAALSWRRCHGCVFAMSLVEPCSLCVCPEQCDSEIALRQGGYTFRWQGIKFINTTKKVLWTAPYKQIFWDLDGSLTGQPNGWVTPYYKWNNWPGVCSRQTSVYDRGLICDNTTVVRRLQFDNVSPYQLNFLYMNLTSAAGTDTMPFLPVELYGWVMPVVGQRAYNFGFQSLIDWQAARIRYSEPEYVQPNEWIHLSTNFTDYRLDYRVRYGSSYQFRSWNNTRLPIDTVDPAGTGAMGTVNLTDSAPNNTWNVVINNVAATSNDWFKYTINVDALQCPLSGCPVPFKPVCCFVLLHLLRASHRLQVLCCAAYDRGLVPDRLSV